MIFTIVKFLVVAFSLEFNTKENVFCEKGHEIFYGEPVETTFSESNLVPGL